MLLSRRMPEAVKSQIRDRFAQAIARPESQIDLAEAAFLIAAEEYTDLDVQAELDRLDALAAEARTRIGDVPISDSDEFIRRFNDFLFQELGFRGNETDYYDPK